MSTLPPPAPEETSAADQPRYASAKDAKAHAKAEKAYRKASRPWFKKKRFWLLGLIVLLFIFALATGGDADDTTTTGSSTSADANNEAVQPASDDAAADEDAAEEEAAAEEEEAEAPAEAPAMEVSAQEMITDLEGNALAAANKYKDQRVVVTGKVDNIDASGNYFTVRGDDEFTFTGVQLFIDESHLETVSQFSQGQDVTVTGMVTDVGEILGYSIDVESIN